MARCGLVLQRQVWRGSLGQVWKVAVPCGTEWLGKAGMAGLGQFVFGAAWQVRLGDDR